MGEKTITIRVATISNPSPTEPNRLYVADLVELTHNVSSVYFIQRPDSMFRYDSVYTQDLEMLHNRMTKAGARAMHLTPEESEEVLRLFSGRDNDKLSKLLTDLNKRVKQAGLKGTEKEEAKGMRKSSS